MITILYVSKLTNHVHAQIKYCNHDIEKQQFNYAFL